jgi:hypothetical protein
MPYPLLIAGLLIFAKENARAQRQPPPDGVWRIVADPFAGLHFFGPTRLSLTSFVGVGNGNPDTPAVDSKFFLLMAEPGWGASRVSLAYVRWMGLRGALLFRATALRYWDNRKAAGGEVQWIVSILPLGARLGLFRSLGRERHDYLVADLALMY